MEERHEEIRSLQRRGRTHTASSFLSLSFLSYLKNLLSSPREDGKRSSSLNPSWTAAMYELSLDLSSDLSLFLSFDFTSFFFIFYLSTYRDLSPRGVNRRQVDKRYRGEKEEEEAQHRSLPAGSGELSSSSSSCSSCSSFSSFSSLNHRCWGDLSSLSLEVREKERGEEERKDEEKEARRKERHRKRNEEEEEARQAVTKIGEGSIPPC